MIRRSRAAIAALLVVAQVACLGPVRQYRPAGDYVRNAAPSLVLVTLTDGTTYELSGPQVVLDSLLGGWTQDGTRYIDFPLTQVESVAARERSAGRTALLVGTVAVAIIAAVAMSTGTGFDTGAPDPEEEP